MAVTSQKYNKIPERTELWDIINIRSLSKNIRGDGDWLPVLKTKLGASKVLAEKKRRKLHCAAVTDARPWRAHSACCCCYLIWPLGKMLLLSCPKIRKTPTPWIPWTISKVIFHSAFLSEHTKISRENTKATNTPSHWQTSGFLYYPRPGQQTTVHKPNAGRCLCLCGQQANIGHVSINKVLLVQATPVPLPMIYGSFHATRAELTEPTWPTKPKAVSSPFLKMAASLCPRWLACWVHRSVASEYPAPCPPRRSFFSPSHFHLSLRRWGLPERKAEPEVVGGALQQLFREHHHSYTDATVQTKGFSPWRGQGQAGFPQGL